MNGLTLVDSLRVDYTFKNTIILVRILYLHYDVHAAEEPFSE